MHSSKTCTRVRSLRQGQGLRHTHGGSRLLYQCSDGVCGGFFSFFLFTFLAIVGIMICNGLGHRFNYADSYKYISFPAGCVVLAISLIFFGTLWLRRKFSRG